MIPNRLMPGYAPSAIKAPPRPFTEADPIRVRQPAAGEADEIHQQRQTFSVVPGRQVYVDDAHRWIAEQVVFESAALDGDAADEAGRSEKPAHAPSARFCSGS